MNPWHPAERSLVHRTHIARLTTAIMLVFLAACGTSSAVTSPPSPSRSSTVDGASRPASPVVVHIVSPTNGETVHGTTVHVTVSISGGEVVRAASTHIDPTHGHVHLYMDNSLVQMAYTLEQDLPVQAGQTYSLYAEFVAADHVQFNPRDRTPTIFFTVAPS